MSEIVNIKSIHLTAYKRKNLRRICKMYLECRIWNYHIIGGRFRTNIVGEYASAKDALKACRATISRRRRETPNQFDPRHTLFEVQVYDIENKKRVGTWTIKH